MSPPSRQSLLIILLFGLYTTTYATITCSMELQRTRSWSQLVQQSHTRFPRGAVYDFAIFNIQFPYMPIRVRMQDGVEKALFNLTSVPDLLQFNCPTMSQKSRTVELSQDPEMEYVVLSTQPSLFYPQHLHNHSHLSNAVEEQDQNYLTVVFPFKGVNGLSRFSFIDANKLEQCVFEVIPTPEQRRYPLAELLLDENENEIPSFLSKKKTRSFSCKLTKPIEQSISKTVIEVPYQETCENSGEKLIKETDPAFLELHLHAFSRVAVGVMGGIKKEVVPTMMDNSGKETEQTANSEMPKKQDEETRKFVPELALPPMKQMISTLVTDSVTFHVIDNLVPAMTSSLGDFVTKSVMKSVETTLTPVLVDRLVESLSTELNDHMPPLLERHLALRLLANLTNSVTHSTVGALTHGMWGMGDTQSNEKGTNRRYCDWCYRYQQTCPLCGTSREASAAISYHSTYYSEHYASYYSTYYTKALENLDALEYQTEES